MCLLKRQPLPIIILTSESKLSGLEIRESRFRANRIVADFHAPSARGFTLEPHWAG